MPDAWVTPSKPGQAGLGMPSCGAIPNWVLTFASLAACWPPLPVNICRHLPRGRLHVTSGSL